MVFIIVINVAIRFEMRTLRRWLRNQRDHLMDTSAKAHDIKDNSVTFRLIDAKGDELRKLLRRHLSAQQDKVGLSILDEYEKFDTTEDRLVHGITEKSDEQISLLRKAQQITESVLKRFRGTNA